MKKILLFIILIILLPFVNAAFKTNRINATGNITSPYFCNATNCYSVSDFLVDTTGAGSNTSLISYINTKDSAINTSANLRNILDSIYQSITGAFTNINWTTLYDAKIDRFTNTNFSTRLTASNIGNYSSAVLNNVSATSINSWIIGNVTSANATMKAYVDANSATSANVLSWVGNYSSAVLNNVSATTIGTWILGNVTSANSTMKSYVDSVAATSANVKSWVGNYSSAVLNNVSATSINSWIIGNVTSANATMKAYVDANTATSTNVLSWVGNYSSAVLNNISAATIGIWIFSNISSANSTMKDYVDARVSSMYNTTYTNNSIISYTDNRFSSMSNLSSTTIGTWILGNVTSANSTMKAYVDTSGFLKNNSVANMSIINVYTNLTFGNIGIWNNGSHLCFGGC